MHTVTSSERGLDAHGCPIPLKGDWMHNSHLPTYLVKGRAACMYVAASVGGTVPVPCTHTHTCRAPMAHTCTNNLAV